jgi:hypothetical protein
MSADSHDAPGAWVTGQSRRATLRVWLLLGLFGASLLGGALAAQLGWLSSRAGAAAGFGLCALALLAFGAAEQRSVEAMRWIRGSRAEREVGAELELLRADGAIVAHDVETERGNVDHVVALARGAYVVETKYRRYDERHLRQAKRNAYWLHERAGVWVTPVICLGSRADRPYRREGVWIMGKPHLVAWLRRRRGRRIDLERLRRALQR